MATLESILSRGVAEGIITSQQADGLRALTAGEAPPTPPTPPTRPAEQPSLVVEALGYLGGIIVLVGAILVASQFWPELGDGGQLAIVLGAAVALLVAGAAVPSSLGATGTRLRAVLWALSVVALTGALGKFFYDVLDFSGPGVDATAVPPLMAALATAYALVLWFWRPSVLQLAVAAAGSAFTAGLTGVAFDLRFGAVAASVLAVGAIWIALGWSGVVRPARPAVVIGSLIAFVGGQLVAVGGYGPIWGLLAAAGLVGLALYRRDLLILGIGSVGVLISLPVVVYDWFPSVAAAAVSLIVVGVLLVVAALYTARRTSVRA
ncbi:MAG TPA: DUF2157 domain-containing protein [Intrasporangium sp.]|nr:DUF2157 domain-containing protein [Intrasporangium sp.]